MTEANLLFGVLRLVEPNNIFKFKQNCSAVIKHPKQKNSCPKMLYNKERKRNS